MRYFMGLLLLLAMPLAIAEEYTASLEPGRQLILGTLVSGVVKELRVQPGQIVSQGELLLELDQREFQAQLRRTQSLLARASSLFQEALREEERARELYDRTLLSEHDLQKAQIGKLEAESRKHAAAAELMRAKLDLERSRIIAPVGGRILEVQTWKGQPIQNTLRIQPLMTLGATDFLRFTLLLPGKQEITSVQYRAGDRWHNVSRFRLVPAQGDMAPWNLEGWLPKHNLAVGEKVRVRVE